MKKAFVISIITLILISCSENKNVDVGKFNPSLRINRINDGTDYFKNDTIEHIFMKQDYKEIDEDESNVVEDQSSSLEITKENDFIIDSTKKNTELNQVTKQPTAPPNQRVEDSNDQIEVYSSPPVTTPLQTETPSPPIEEPKELAPDPLCPNAWYDENQPCDWIHLNLKPTDEVGRTVPIFSRSEDAWNWAEKQLFDEKSIWYMCGFNLMDGHTNDGTTFYYGYMKACP